MSALLDSLLTHEQREACAANEVGPLRRFVVQIGTRQQTRLLFEAMAVDSHAAWAQHVALCLPLERCDVRAVS